ncbi:hypothetical protein AVEN_76610-1 [Araneus ventricosus]|uniref:Uncharacterized protein n=1 Tax=Araneus ventricosus TaxID=182803 RepID=A0A4Y2QWZ1_ARAVE|nr:hypothetical protein AVEN_76610-1 [Araneus ventricosus]
MQWDLESENKLHSVKPLGAAVLPSLMNSQSDAPISFALDIQDILTSSFVAQRAITNLLAMQLSYVCPPYPVRMHKFQQLKVLKYFSNAAFNFIVISN